jgi:hypothetical protein
MNISINQVLNFWDQLVACFYGVSTFDGTRCEIYLYTMMEHSPTFANNPDSKFCEDGVREAKDAMFKLIARFEERYECTVLEDGEKPRLEGTWRYHLDVKPKGLNDEKR